MPLKPGMFQKYLRIHKHFDTGISKVKTKHAKAKTFLYIMIFQFLPDYLGQA